MRHESRQGVRVAQAARVLLSVLSVVATLPWGTTATTCGDRLIFMKKCIAFDQGDPPISSSSQTGKAPCKSACETALATNENIGCCQYVKVRCPTVCIEVVCVLSV